MVKLLFTSKFCRNICKARRMFNCIKWEQQFPR